MSTTAPTLPTARHLLLELVGNICRCGKPKVPNQSLCRGCYSRLPREVRHGLYRRLGQGYEGAMHEAVKLLGLGDIAPAPPEPRPVLDRSVCLCGVGNEDLNANCPMHGELCGGLSR